MERHITTLYNPGPRKPHRPGDTRLNDLPSDQMRHPPPEMLKSIQPIPSKFNSLLKEGEPGGWAGLRFRWNALTCGHETALLHLTHRFLLHLCR